MTSGAKIKKISKLTLVAMGGLLLALSISSTAVAETCKIKDWRWNTIAKNRFVKVEAETTCQKGVMFLRQYWHWNGKKTFAGTAMAVINGYSFTALFDTLGNRPNKKASMSLRFDYQLSLSK